MIKLPPIRLSVRLLILMLVLLPASWAWQKTVTVTETDLVSIHPKAVDPEQQPISYFYSRPINSSGQWQTGYDDAGQYGIDISASDGQKITAERILLTVKDKNRLLEIEPITITALEGETISLELPLEDEDGDPLSYDYPAPFNNLGKWLTTYQDSGDYYTTITVNDGQARSEVSAHFIITNNDRQPFLEIPSEIYAAEGKELVLEIDALDPDGDSLTLSVHGLPEGAELKDETLRWTPPYNTVQRSGRLISNWLNAVRLENKLFYPVKFPLTVSACSNDSCENKSTTLIVSNVNQKPQFFEAAEFTIKTYEELKINVSANDPDDDIIKYYFSQPFNRHTGTWKPKPGQEGDYTIFATASDGTDQTSMPILVHVIRGNSPPILKAKVKSITVNEGELVEIALQATDLDNDTVDITVEQPPDGSSIVNNTFSWTPSFDEIKEKSQRLEDNLISKIATINRIFSSEQKAKELVFTAFDGQNKNSEVVTLIIKNVNQPPRVMDFLPERKTTVTIGEPVVFNIAAKDPDGNKLDYEWSFSLHEPRIKGTNSIERTFVTPGEKTVTVMVSDGRNSLEIKWKVTVLPAEDFDISSTEAYLGAAQQFTVYVIKG